jgi:hypothetical protein
MYRSFFIFWGLFFPCTSPSFLPLFPSSALIKKQCSLLPAALRRPARRAQELRTLHRTPPSLIFLPPRPAVAHTCTLPRQTSILNGASLFGRTLPPFVADHVGRFNGARSVSFPRPAADWTTVPVSTVIIPMTTVAGVLMFAMLGAKSVGGMTAFAVLYGFFSGCCACACRPVFRLVCAHPPRRSPRDGITTGGRIRKEHRRRRVRSLLTPFLSYHIAGSESLIFAPEISIRIGFACFIWSFALLFGNPISGALLRAPHYFWSRSIVFNAVRHYPFSPFHLTD